MRDAQLARSTAVSHHDANVSLFEDRYQRMHADRFASAFSHGRDRLDALLMSHLQRLPKGSSIIDIGCGTGEQLREFSRFGFFPVGIEPAARMRQVAQQTNPGVEILEGTVLDLPIAEARFEMVVAIEVLRYLDRADWELAFREILRVLRPGGFMFITLVNRYALDGFFLFHRLRSMALSDRLSSERPHCEFVTPSDVRTLVESAGAVDIELTGRMFAPLRVAYKLHSRLGAAAARRLEPFERRLERMAWHTPVAGHLVLVARKPAAGSRSSVS